jgi:hypothetical protein
VRHTRVAPQVLEERAWLKKTSACRPSGSFGSLRSSTSSATGVARMSTPT